MNRILLILLFICTAGYCFSQEISVKSFKLLNTDLTANTAGTSEMDQNGETAALIKVVTTESGFSFDCGMLGIVKTKQTPGEIWVYIPRGAQKITIKHPQLGILRNYFFPLSIEGARTYEMVLTTGKVTTVVKEARTSQYVVFNLSPKNAIVEFEGQLLHTSDGVATKLVKFGTYSYKVQAPDYISTTGKVTVSNPNEKTIVDVNLNPNFSKVTINVDAEAEIWVNGEMKGQGTWTGNLGEGEYEFEAKKQNYRSTLLRKSIAVSTEPQVYQLETPHPIMVEANINSDPAMADIYVDGIKIGQTPKLFELLIGKHRINITKTGYESCYKDTTIIEGVPFELSIQMEKQGIDYKRKELLSKIKDKNLKKGNKTTKDGGEYYGDISGGVPNGIGMALYKNGNKYEGEYVKGMRQGYGVYYFFDGERYEGEWFQDQQHGKGVYYFLNNNRYEGLWFRDYQQGHGVMYYYNGNKYDGEWKQDKRSGYGVYTFTNGAYYKGYWLNDKRDGKGLYDWADGAVYDGEWKMDMRSGKGTFKYVNGDVYIGQWAADQMNGQGIYKFQNGDVYEGDFVQGYRTGQGVLKYANGEKYTGQFYKDQRQGQGTFVWQNGSKYEGEWKNDIPNGSGKLTESTGKIYEGTFKDGQFVSF